MAISGGVTQPLQEQLTNGTLTSRRCTPQFDGFVCVQLRGTYWSVFLSVCVVCACDKTYCVCMCVRLAQWRKYTDQLQLVLVSELQTGCASMLAAKIHLEYELVSFIAESINS